MRQTQATGGGGLRCACWSATLPQLLELRRQLPGRDAAARVEQVREPSRAVGPAGVQSHLVGLHVWRFAGSVFLIMAALGRLPWLFALPAGLGDVAVASMAPVVARRLRRSTGRRSTMAWNAFGLLDLVVAVGLGAIGAATTG